MLIPNGDSTFMGGPLDILCILKLPAGTFHATFFEEKPLPGPVEPVNGTRIVRLQSRMHHTVGAVTLEGAQEHLARLCEQIQLPEGSIVRDRAIEVDDPVGVWVLHNWTNGGSLAEELRKVGYLPEV